MRTIPPNIATQRARHSSKPFYVLEIEFGGAVGTKRFSGRDLSSIITPSPIVAVTEWGTLSSAVDFRNGTAAPVTDVTITLTDCTPLGRILSWIRSTGIEFKPATIYVGFEDTGSTLVPLLRGIANSPVDYAQVERHMSVDITNLSVLYDTALATRVSMDDMPYLAPDEDGKIVPICYGSPRKVQTIRAKAAIRTTLSRYVTESATAFYVDDAEDFPQGTNIKVRIGCEIMEGTFSGNTFTTSSRGATLLSSTTTQVTANEYKIRDVSLIGYPDDFFVNYFVKIDFGDGQGLQMRPIVGFDGVNGVIMYTPPFRYPNYSNRIVLAGVSYTIGSVQADHSMGDDVSLVLNEYKWVVCDGSAAGIDKVYVRVAEVDESDVNAATTVNSYTYEHWAELDKRFYYVNTADTSIVPGHTVTVVVMLWEPLSAPGAYSGAESGSPLSSLELGPCPYASNELLVDLEFNSTNHPADIILDVLQTRLGVSPADIDLASFTIVATATATYEFNFALYDEIQGQEFLAQLAFQSCNAILWDEGKIHLKQLMLSASPSQKEIPIDRIYEDSAALTHSALENIITEVNTQITEDGDEIVLTYENTTAISRYGRRTDNLNLWCIDTRRMAHIVSSFWLYFWALPYEIIEFSTPLTEIELQLLDAVTLTNVAILPANQRVRIVRIDHHPGHGENRIIDRITFQAQVPLTPGCQGSCEWFCENSEVSACSLSGCETSCEVACTYVCRETCQQVCELLGCVSSCEMFCTEPCQFACQEECQIVCTAGQDGGCVACVSAPCQTECEQNGNECGTTEIPCCTESCEGEDCVAGCNEGCVVGCEEPCETPCQLEPMQCGDYCQINCTSWCTFCNQVDCVAECTEGCTSSCTIGCEATCREDCQDYCRASSCTLACEASGGDEPTACQELEMSS